ncbi:MAG: radical SAM protein [Saprospiraceae bacterium]|nr:radical SAM protein [Lewinella sp.]
MNILLVRPDSAPETIGLQHLMLVEPLELEILGALKRSGDTVTLVDMILEKKDIGSFLEQYRPDLLAITGYITNVNTMLAYARRAKGLIPGIQTVVGGVHCEVCPEDFDDPAVDFRVVRNAVQAFPALLDFIDQNGALPMGVLRKGETLEDIILPLFDFTVPFPDRSLSKRYREKYFYIFQNRVALIKTSFGCPYTCSFCFCREITSGAYHTRPLDEVLDELEMIEEEEVYIVDDDFLIDRKRLLKFIEGVQERGIHKRYLIYGRADFIVRYPEVMARLRDVGLHTVIVGFESFSEEELQQFEKKISVETNREAMRIMNRLGIECFATIIVSPDWNRADFRHMVRETRALGVHFVNLQPLTPLPKTGFSVPEDQLLIPKEEYEKWDLAHLSIRPAQLSIPDFYREILKAYQAILFQPAILWKYIRNYPLKMLWRMLKGSYRVTRQYRNKITESEAYAKDIVRSTDPVRQ